MFTGIIEELGIVTSILHTSHGGKLILSVGKAFGSVKIGESIAVNGACLTVTAVRKNFLEFDLSAETMKRTTFTDLRIGDKVNLERALLASGRLGGHLVSGHVDGIGEIKNKIGSAGGFELQLSIPSALLRYLVPKGSITLEGVSLTVSDIRGGLVFIAVIPHTAETTSLGLKNAGDRLNIEVDLLSKYIEKHLRGAADKGVTEEMLTRVGFLPMGWIEN